LVSHNPTTPKDIYRSTPILQPNPAGTHCPTAFPCSRFHLSGPSTMAPLINHLYTADPSAHVFNGKIYIYPSHDRETDIKFNDNGDQYDMADYHVFSTSSLDPLEPVVDHGVVLKTEDIPWVSKQLWAPDAAFKDGKYYLYFPARDKQDVFRIGVAVSDKPEGPFTPDPEPIKGSYSIDPASFVDNDGQAYPSLAVCGAASSSVTKRATTLSMPSGSAPRSPLVRAPTP